MTPKEKAEDLFTRFNKDGLHQIAAVINRTVRKEMIKQCAILAVDEIIQQWKSPDTYFPDLGGDGNPDLKYWLSVREAIENI